MIVCKVEVIDGRPASAIWSNLMPNEIAEEIRWARRCALGAPNRGTHALILSEEYGKRHRSWVDFYNDPERRTPMRVKEAMLRRVEVARAVSGVIQSG